MLLQTFEKLTDTYVIAVLPFDALGAAAVFPLRKQAGYSPSFRTPGYPIVPLLFIASTIFLLGNAVVEPDTRHMDTGDLRGHPGGDSFLLVRGERTERDADNGSATMGKARMEMFSDGVLAVVITIMVLELRPPTAPSLAPGPPLPVFLSYVLSFAFLGLYWNNHHHLLYSVRRVTGAILSAICTSSSGSRWSRS